MMINRGAVLVRYKEPFAKWINETGPEGDEDLTLEELNADRTIYMVDDTDIEAIDQWVSLNFHNIFETELEDWSGDEADWPEDRTLEMFNEWCVIECHGVIIDTVGTPIEVMDDFVEGEFEEN